MTVREDKVMARNLQAVTVATLIILLAIAALIIGLTDAEWYVAIYVVLVGFGVMLVVRGMLLPKKEGIYASPGDVSLVWGVLIAMVGVIGLVSVYVSDNIWVLLALGLLTIGILVLLMTMKGMLKKR